MLITSYIYSVKYKTLKKSEFFFGFSDLQLARGLETNLVQGVNQLKGSFKTGQSKLYTTLNLNPSQSLSVKLI